MDALAVVITKAFCNLVLRHILIHKNIAIIGSMPMFKRLFVCSFLPLLVGILIYLFSELFNIPYAVRNYLRMHCGHLH